MVKMLMEQRNAMALLHDKIVARYPALSGRLRLAVRMVESGAVQVYHDTIATVQSNEDTPYDNEGTPYYYEVRADSSPYNPNSCTCGDFVYRKAPRGMCKHRLAVFIWRRIFQTI